MLFYSTVWQTKVFFIFGVGLELEFSKVCIFWDNLMYGSVIPTTDQHKHSSLTVLWIIAITCKVDAVRTMRRTNQLNRSCTINHTVRQNASYWLEMLRTLGIISSQWRCIAGVTGVSCALPTQHNNTSLSIFISSQQYWNDRHKTRKPAITDMQCFRKDRQVYL